jgi:hypothetical protein
MPIQTNALTPWASIEALDKAAKFLHQAADDAGREVPNQLKKAGKHGLQSVGHVAGAVANVVQGTGHAVLGTAAVIDSGAALAVGGGSAALGAGAWTVEEGLKGTAWLAHNLAKALVKLCNFLNKVAGSGDRYEINKILGDPTAEKISTKLFKFSGDAIELSKDFAKFGWDNYVKAFDLGVLGTTGNVVLAAGHLGMVGIHLGGAAIYAGDAAAIKMAELSVLAAKVAVEYAQQGVKAAADATLIAAKASAAVGNFLQHQADPHYKISPKQVAELEGQLKALAAA